VNSILVIPCRRDGWWVRGLPILAAALMAATLGAACGDKVARLTHDLTSGDDQVCQSAARALGAIGPDAASAAPAMFEVIVTQRRAPGRTCWTTVVDELPKLGTAAAASILLTALGDKRAEDAGYVLAGMGASALPVLSKALGDPKAVDGAIDVIAVLATTAAPLLGDLREARKSRRLSERRFVISISWFRSEQTVPDFAAALRSEDIEVRWAAVRALGDFAARSSQAVKALAFALQDDSAEIRNEALEVLSRAGPAARPALPAVRAAAARRLVSPRMAQMAIARIQPQ
jgi:HEAT repeat protein